MVEISFQMRRGQEITFQNKCFLFATGDDNRTSIFQVALNLSAYKSACREIYTVRLSKVSLQFLPEVIHSGIPTNVSFTLITSAKECLRGFCKCMQNSLLVVMQKAEAKQGGLSRALTDYACILNPLTCQSVLSVLSNLCAFCTGGIHFSRCSVQHI